MPGFAFNKFVERLPDEISDRASAAVLGNPETIERLKLINKESDSSQAGFAIQVGNIEIHRQSTLCHTRYNGAIRTDFIHILRFYC
jgi:hypothetical protein